MSMTGSQRPTFTPVVDETAEPDITGLIIEASRKYIDRQGEMTGNQAEKLQIRATFHNELWKLTPDREVSPTTIAATEMLDAAIEMWRAKDGQQFAVIATQLGRLGALAALFAPKPTPTEPAAEEKPKGERPERTPALSPAASRILGMGQTPTPPASSPDAAA
jgi:hypothetical protein